jgi:hypothetical protein
MGWDKITVEQYEYLEPICKKIQAEKDPLYRIELWVHVLTFLTGKDKEHFETMDGNKLRDLIHSHNFLLHPELCNKIESTITVNNQFYKGLTDITSGSFAPYYMLKTHLANDAPLSSLLGCVYSPIKLWGIKYDMDQVSKDLKQAKCSQVLGLVFFYSRIFNRLMPAIQGYLEIAESQLAHQDLSTQKPMDGM